MFWRSNKQNIHIYKFKNFTFLKLNKIKEDDVLQVILLKLKSGLKKRLQIIMETKLKSQVNTMVLKNLLILYITVNYMETLTLLLMQRIFVNLIFYHVKSANQLGNQNLQKIQTNQIRHFIITGQLIIVKVVVDMFQRKSGQELKIHIILNVEILTTQFLKQQQMLYIVVNIGVLIVQADQVIFKKNYPNCVN